MIARIKKLSVRTKGMEALQAVILLGAAFLIIWGLMALYDGAKGDADANIKSILKGKAGNAAGGAGAGAGAGP